MPRGYVGTAFNNLQKHDKEVDMIVREAYDKPRDASKAGTSVETVSNAQYMLETNQWSGPSLTRGFIT